MGSHTDFCDRHLQLLFTVLQAAKDPRVRANVIIALGDMTFRFPNNVEPWSKHMYKRLRDSEAGVRKNTLMVRVPLSSRAELTVWLAGAEPLDSERHAEGEGPNQ